MSDSTNSTDTELWEGAGALFLVIALQLLVAVLSEQRGWTLWTLPWWIWLIPIGPEVVLLVYLWAIDDAPEAMVLALVMGTVNGLLLTVLIGSVIGSHEHSGGQLLLKGVTVWATNVTAFAVTFWEFSARGRRQQKRHFRFPQQDNPGSHFKPSFFDYFYVSFTNSIAFSPTDAMPMTKRAKLLMLVESAASAVAVLLVAARAVNIFK